MEIRHPAGPDAVYLLRHRLRSVTASPRTPPASRYTRVFSTP